MVIVSSSFHVDFEGEIGSSLGIIDLGAQSANGVLATFKVGLPPNLRVNKEIFLFQEHKGTVVSIHMTFGVPCREFVIELCTVLQVVLSSCQRHVV